MMMIKDVIDKYIIHELCNVTYFLTFFFTLPDPPWDVEMKSQHLHFNKKKVRTVTTPVKVS